MSEVQGEYLTIDPDPDYGPLPPFDGNEHMAFPGTERRVIARAALDGLSVPFLASQYGCSEDDIEHALRITSVADAVGAG